ncbi:MAG: hypothetical protein FGM18_04330 [Burkholderiaceae bacterium]|nr:hypothetical protein [Burkholderiaceae bacterium]
MDRILIISRLNLPLVRRLQVIFFFRGSPLLCSALLVGMTMLGPSAVHAKAKEQAAESASASIIVQAKEAFAKGRLPELERLMAKSQGHLLAAWPDYWRLKLLLGIPSTDGKMMRANVQAFLARHPKHPLREHAQRDWIAALISKNLWSDVAVALESLPPQLTSPGIQCAKAKLGLLPTEPEGQKAQFIHLAAGQETADACLALIEDLAKAEVVALNYLRQRARWAAQVGSDASHGRMIEILRTHAKAHELGARGPDPFKTEAQLGQILKASRVDSLSSLPILARHKKDLTHEQVEYASFAVGAAIWRRSHADAWGLMQEGWSSLGQQPDEALQAAAREAIRRSAWPKLLDIIAAMREPLRTETAWQYWRAIALKETRQKEKSEEILKRLRDDFGFYGMLAQEELGSPVRLPTKSEVTLSAEDQKRLDQDTGIQRSYALLRAGMRAEAVMEWSAAMRGRNDAELIRTALHARKAGFYDRMIAAADRTQEEHDFSLRYPTPFKDTVISAAKKKSLDPWWVLGLIRQESRFIPDVKSSVGAAGLMQIMPATGKMLAKEVGMKNTRNLQLTDVELNVQLGTTYMRQLHDRFDGSALLASAAYNAGPSRAVNWRSALPRRIDGAAFAESIPFPETRDYVKRVLSNAVLYHAVHNGGTVPSLRRLLGEVAPGESS